MAFLPAFDAFPEEGALIGRMVAGYGELEFDLCTCLGVTIGDDNAALRALFRARGEDARINIADALMRKKYAAAKITDHYDTMLGALRFCKSARNQYAHSHWFDGKHEGLFFMDLEIASKSSALTTPMVPFYHVDLPLLRQQARYFWYTSGILQFLWREYEKQTGKVSSHTFRMPPPLGQPPLHNPQDLHPPPGNVRKAAASPPDTAPGTK
jgi:hypothetical protein